ncbi:hypothetical protein CesoFtcFv8_027245 [Champsocephalus esox]|uniref:Uncharacterized protein n=1 Tax=Champsocephalus esox TaxID=159716 RepID=A0AAN8B193_9TELE|nr:hypothetical protein CesoFtcFv8_027245 [Champsocephalus esox]
MAHAASHIKKARSEMDQPPDLKALEKARERRKRSRERAERKRKVEADSRITPDSPFIPLPVIHRPSSSDCLFTMQTCSSESAKDFGRALVFMVTDCPHLCFHSHLERHSILMITREKHVIRRSGFGLDQTTGLTTVFCGQCSQCLVTS